MTKATSHLRVPPIPGPAAKTPEWYEGRRHGISATEVAKLAKGYASDRRRIQREKLTGDRVDLDGKRAIEYGKLREPLIAAWIFTRFGIPSNDLLYLSGVDARHFATPDGFEIDPITGLIYVSEIKTSEHDLTPGKIDDEGILVLTKGPGGKWFLYDNYFAKTGYYDQMQWQMFVTGAERTLFAWEQHDGDWSGWPTHAPKTLTLEPGWCWVLRDDKRIAELVEIAEKFLAELEQLAAAIEAGDAEAPPLSAEEEEQLQVQKRAQELKRENARELGLRVIAARAEKDRAEERRAEAQKQLDELLADETDWVEEDSTIRISRNTTTPTRKVLDREGMMAKHGAVVEKYERIVQRFTREIPGDPKTTTTVTARKG